MMTTRRSLFVFSALLAALLVPAMSFAQATVAPTGDVAGVTATRVGGDYDSLDVGWTASAQLTDTTSNEYPLTGYRVYYREGSTAIVTTDLRSIATFMDVSGLTTVTATLEGLKANTMYQVAVVLANAAGVGPVAASGATASATVTAVPDLTAPVLTLVAGDGEIEASWTASSGNPDSYKVSWWPKAGGVTSSYTTMDAMTRMYTISGLESETAYEVTVMAMRGDTEGPVSDTEEATTTAGTGTTTPTPTSLSVPGGFTVVPGDMAGEVDASWTAVMGASGYQIESSPTNSNVSTMHTVTGGNETGASITGLTVGQAYTFRIRAVDATDRYTDSAWSSSVEEEPGAGTEAKPAPPRDVTLTARGRNSIHVTWKAGQLEGVPPTDDSARIRYEVGWTDTAATTAFVPMSTPASVARNETSYTVKGLKVGVTYRVAVRSIKGNTAGAKVSESGWVMSTAGSEMTPAAATGPQAVQVTASDGELKVTWREQETATAPKSVADCMGMPSGGWCGFRVEWKAANQTYDDPNRQKDLKGSDVATEYTITGLTNGVEYSVRVSARNERSSMFYRSDNEARATPMADMISTPNPVEAVAGDGQVTVMWTGVEGAAKYRVQWRTAAQSYNSTRQAEGFYQRTSGELEHSHTIEGLENGMTYMFRVFAVDADGMMSNPSDEVSAMPGMPTPALPLFGALALGAGLVAAGRRRLRARRQPRLLKA